jgi:hypothetical protein
MFYIIKSYIVYKISTKSRSIKELSKDVFKNKESKSVYRR